MSFSGEVKQELVGQLGAARHCRIAEFAGILAFCGRVSRQGTRTALFLQTENRHVASKAQQLLKRTFGIRPQISVRQAGSQSAGRIYTITVWGCGDETERLLNAVKRNDILAQESYLFCTQSEELADSRIIQSDCCRRAFLRGAFLAAGSISNPEKSYHFEIVCHQPKQARQLQTLINGYGMDAKIIRRKKYYVVYIKESEQIADLLKLMGAYLKLLDLENLRIVKDMRNTVNRKVNCETANLTKTVSAAVEQIQAIEYIRDTIGFSGLPEVLEETARIRLEYKDATLKELGEMMSPKVGKSGVNHRLRKLKQIAEDVKEQREGMV